MIWLLALNLVFTSTALVILAGSTKHRIRAEYMRGYADGAETIINGQYTSLEIEMEDDK
jgi:hypothetical protein